jgi:hypothetical protein
MRWSIYRIFRRWNTWSRLGNVEPEQIGIINYSGGNKLWSVQDYTRWHVATTPLPTEFQLFDSEL